MLHLTSGLMHAVPKKKGEVMLRRRMCDGLYTADSLDLVGSV